MCYCAESRGLWRRRGRATMPASCRFRLRTIGRRYGHRRRTRQLFAQIAAEQCVFGRRIPVLVFDQANSPCRTLESIASSTERVARFVAALANALEGPRDRGQIVVEPVELFGKTQTKNGDKAIARQHVGDEPLTFPCREDIREEVSQQEHTGVNDEPNRGGDDPSSRAYRLGALAGALAARAGKPSGGAGR